MIVFILSINLLLFYSMTLLWNEKFTSYFECVSDQKFKPINIQGNAILAGKFIAVLLASFAINFFFYLSIEKSGPTGQKIGKAKV